MNQTFSTPPSGDVTQTLNGPFAFTLTNGKLTKLDLMNELGKIGKFSGGSKGYTAISSMSGTFDVHNGVANTNDLKAALDVGTMAATGTINLVNEALGLHLTAVLDKGFSQSVGGSGVGGYLNTALANKNGELVLPVIITGTMSHPAVAPDLQKIAQMKLNNIVPSARRHSRIAAGRKISAARPTGREACGPTVAAATNTGRAGWIAGRKQEEAATIVLRAVRQQNNSRPKGRLLFLRSAGGGDYVPVASSSPCSTFSWHSMQWRVQGTASSRLGLISSPQAMHSPNDPSRMRSSAPSTICSVWRSLLLWLNRNSLV